MPRTSITPTDLTAHSAITPVSTTIDATLVTNGVTVPCGGKMDDLLFRVVNSAGSAKILTFNAGDNPPAQRQGIGNLALSIPGSSAVRIVSALESQRFAQAPGGALEIDFESGFTGTIEIYRMGKP